MIKKLEDVVNYVYDKVGSYYFVTQEAFELYWKSYIQKYLSNLKKGGNRHENKIKRISKLPESMD